MNDLAGTFAAVFTALYAAHQVADHLGQTDWMARHKAGATAPVEPSDPATPPGGGGWLALGAHVGVHLAFSVAFLALVWVPLNLSLAAAYVGAGLAIVGGTHALWDRRRPVRWLLERTGSPKFAALASNGMNGAYLADQALHVAGLFAGAWVMVALPQLL